MKVILISGKAQHGKDTSALILEEIYEAENKRVLITHYADLLKYICKQYFNWDGKKDEKTALLLALKPYMSPERCDAIDKLIMFGRISEVMKQLR